MTLIKITMQPMLKQYASFFNCFLIEGKYYLKLDPNLICWETEHLDTTFVLIIPSLFFLVYLPLFVFFWFLMQHKDELEKEKIQAQVWQFTQGFKSEYFYWEFVKLIKKMLIIFIIIFLNEKPLLSIFVILLLIIIYFVLHLIVENYSLYIHK